MDVLADFCNHKVEEYFTEPPFGLEFDNPIRMYAIFWLILAVLGVISYFVASGATYLVIYVLFPKQLLAEEDKIINKGQIAREILVSVRGIPVIATITAPFYMLHWMGYGELYYDFNDRSIGYFIISLIWFLAFTDCLIYWIHWGLHIEPLYTWLHSTHHSFLSPTPWAAIAFNPFDGWAQALPYHIFTFLFPFNNWAYLIMFAFVQLWTISIHDRVSFTSLDGIVNGSAHHAGHHFYYRYNFGQYFTLWDRLNGTHRPWDFPKSRTCGIVSDKQIPPTEMLKEE